MGFFGAPRSPRLDEIGIPISMWVAWMSPLDSASRMAAQLAPLITVELMPYFLNRPFSCAITIGEQSVSAIMPKRMSGVSGALDVADELPVPGAGVDAATVVVTLLSLLQAPSVAAPRPTAACMKRRRPRVVD